MIQLTIDFLVQNTVWSFLTCSLVFCIAGLFRRRPALVHFACVMALVAMLTPPLFSIALPVSDWLGDYHSLAKSDNQEAAVAPALSTRELALDSRSHDERVDLGASGRAVQSGESTSTALAAAPRRVSSSEGANGASIWIWLSANYAGLLVSVWLVGSLFYFLLMIKQVLQFNGLVTQAKPASNRLNEMVEIECCRIQMVRKPVVLEIAARVSPFVYQTILGPRLVMPSDLADQLSDNELRSLVLHELVHLQRRDPMVRILEIVVTTIFWFNPVLWVLRDLLRRSEELACDAVVADTYKSQPETYAGAFLKTIDFLSGHRKRCPSTLVCTVGGYRHCSQRLKAMVKRSNQIGLTRVQRVFAVMLSAPLLLAGIEAVPVSNSPESVNVSEAIVKAGVEFEQVAPSRYAASVENHGSLTTTDLKVIKELSGLRVTRNIIFHFRPEDLNETELAKVVDSNAEKFMECEHVLNMQYNGRVHIFLYRDVDDLQKTTGTNAVAFATGTTSVHQAIDFNSVHELTHIFALQFPGDEDRVTDNFAVEGLATSLAQVDEDIPIHSWAAVYQAKSRLPDLVELRRSWPSGTLPGVHPYHVAGSFVGYLIEQFGIERVKRWYVHSTEAHMEFGKTFRRLERDWLAWLQERDVDPKHRDHIESKLGMVPEKFASAKQFKLFDGKSLQGLTTDDSSKWKVDKNGRLIGADKNSWSFVNSSRKFAVNAGAKVKFRLVNGKAISIRLNCTDDSSNHLNMATWSTYVSFPDGGYIGLPNLKVKTGEWNEVVFVNDNGTARFYLNGSAIGEYKDACRLNKGSLGLGVEGGTIEVKEFIGFEHSNK